MTAPYLPDPEWHKQKTPEEWQAIQTQALRDHRTNPHDQEAMNAIRDSNEALNLYEKPAIEAGEHTLTSGWGNPLEAVKGEAEGGLNALLAPFHIASTVYRDGPSAAINEMVEGIKSIPGEIASGDSRRIGRVGGNVAGGIAAGKLMGKLGSGLKGTVEEFAARPGLKNQLIKSQINALQTGLAKSHATMPDVIEQAGLKTDMMKDNVSKNKGSLDAQTERPGLQNDLTRLQIEKLQKALEPEDDIDPEAGPPAEGAPLPPKPPTVTPSGNPTADAARNEHLASDPYGLNDVAKPGTPPPPDILDNFIQSLKARTGDPNPVSPLDRTGNEAPPPLSPEALNELLNQVRRKPPNKG